MHAIGAETTGSKTVLHLATRPHISPMQLAVPNQCFVPPAAAKLEPKLFRQYECP